MKKISSILSSILSLAVLIGLSGSFTSISAQTQAEKSLADFIKARTNRTFAGLVEQRQRDGGVSVDLQGRFQNLMLARLGYDGEPVAACVEDLQQANIFFGKDLETGRLLAGYEPPFDTSIKDEAARHGMSPEELVYYKNMIEQAAQRLALSPDSATISIVNNDGADEGFNDPAAVSPEGGNNAATRGAQRLAVFQTAAAIWGTYLDSSVTIRVRSQFDPQTCTATSAVLGSAGTIRIYRDFPNADLAGTWYHKALANKLSNQDRDTTNPDINATFNSNLNGDPNCLGGGRFYLGFDNATPSGTINLLVVLLHEFSHGLGFSSFANGSTGALNGGFPDVYTTRLYDRTTNKYWNAMTDAERQASAVNTNNLLWDGANVKIASGFLTAGRDTATGRVLVYTPSTFAGGSSVSHWSTAATPNLLMEPFINTNIPLTLDLTPHLLRDVGWYRDTNLDGTPDTITSVTPSGGSVPPNSTATITWSNGGGFNKNVTIDLSIDGGATYPTRLATNIANSGSFTFTVPNTLTTQAKVRVREHDFAQPVGESAAVFTIGNAAPRRVALDFDGDGKTDVGIFRPVGGQWWINRSSTNVTFAVSFGDPSDKITPADFTGDGKTDLAFFRPSNGTWYILRSEDFSFYGFPFGASTDIPVAADFDGDGKSDAAVFRPANSGWYIQKSSGGIESVTFGLSGDKPVVADYDGDGKADIAITRINGANREWWIRRSSNGQVFSTIFGDSSDKAVQNDYTGDGKADIAIWRPSNGYWYVLRSEDFSFYGFPFGTNGDVPAPGDFDGDGKTDATVFRAANSGWYQLRTTQGFTAVTFGTNGDIPVQTAYQP